jgi:chemotaxis signal transduction protein
MSYLAVAIGDQICGLERASIKELLAYMNFAPSSTPSTDPAFLGNFRYRDGRPVMVFDLRIRLGIAPTRTGMTSMMLADLNGQLVALIVDNVIGMQESVGQILDLPACVFGPYSAKPIAA